MSIFMCVANAGSKDPVIKGSSTEAQHVAWIPIKSCEFPVERPGVNTRPGKVTDRLRSGVTFPAISLGKECDVASPGLMKWMVDGETYDVLIAFCKEKGEHIFLITLSNTLCTKLSTSCSGEDQPTETLSLDFTFILMEYSTYDIKGKTPATAKVTYDLEKAISGSGT